MGFDQDHEQNNKIVNTDSGSIGILENKAALVKWAVSIPQISYMLQEIFSNDKENYLNCHCHHEHADTYEKKFGGDQDDLILSVNLKKIWWILYLRYL